MRLSIVRLLGGLAAVITALTFAVPAVAQDWLADRARAEGPGIRVGDFELHPGIGIEVGYDSNVFYADDDRFASVASGVMRVTPHFNFSTIGQERTAEGEARGGNPPTLQLRGGVSASYYAYFAAAARNNLGVDADINLVLFPEKPFTLTLHERFGRTVRPFTQQSVSDPTAPLKVNFGRNENDAGIEASFGTPGRVLSGRVGYSLIYSFFDSPDFAFANSLTHRFSAGSSFRFLPQTAFVMDFQGDYRTYPSFTPGASSFLSDGFNMRARVGLNGAFTNRLSFTAMVGYAAGWYDARDDFDSIVAQAEVRWQIAGATRFTLGFDRNFAPSYIGNFMRIDRGYIGLQTTFGGSFVLGVDGSIGLIGFGIPVRGGDTSVALGSNPDGTADRSDLRATASVFAEYRFTNWLGVNATLRYTGDFTDYQYNIADPTLGVVPDPAGYSKVEAWFGVRAFY